QDITGNPVLPFLPLDAFVTLGMRKETLQALRLGCFPPVVFCRVGCYHCARNEKGQEAVRTRLFCNPEARNASGRRPCGSGCVRRSGFCVVIAAAAGVARAAWNRAERSAFQP